MPRRKNATLRSFLNRKYEHVGSKNIYNLLMASSLNVNPDQCKSTSPFYVMLTREPNGAYAIKHVSATNTACIKFFPGVEFVEWTLFEKVFVTMMVHRNTIREVRRSEFGQTVTIDRIFMKGKLQMIMKADDVVATRDFKHIK